MGGGGGWGVVTLHRGGGRRLGTIFRHRGKYKIDFGNLPYLFLKSVSLVMTLWT